MNYHQIFFSGLLMLVLSANVMAKSGYSGVDTSRVASLHPSLLSESARGLNRNHKLNPKVKPGQVVDAATIASVEISEASALTVASGIAILKNKAYILRKTRRPVHVIKAHHQISYDYLVRNHKFKK